MVISATWVAFMALWSTIFMASYTVGRKVGRRAVEEVASRVRR